MNRANILILDEFRLINKDTIDTILKKFLTQQRMPDYISLSKAERELEHAKETNETIYLSSAYWIDNWSFTKCKDTFKSMILDEKRSHFVCGLPYQLPIKEGLLNADTVADEMAESDFNEIKFSMEYSAIYYGLGNGTFFDFPTISKTRHIKYPMIPSSVLQNIHCNSSLLKIQPKQPGELRILSADIALMSSRKHDNDATSIFINQLLPNKTGRYTNNIIYGDGFEGKRTDVQALNIRRLYEEFGCDYIVLDAQGVGMGIADALMKEMVDADSGEVYPALSVINDKTMAERCTDPDAEKVIWSIKANAQFNSECAYLLREGFRSRKIRLLATEYDGEEALAENIKEWKHLSQMERQELLMPYVQTTMLIKELIGLQHTEAGNRIKLIEKPGARKDRYSSLSYNYYVAVQLEKDLTRSQSMDTEFNFIIRQPKQHGVDLSNRGRKVRNGSGNISGGRNSAWSSI